MTCCSILLSSRNARAVTSCATVNTALHRRNIVCHGLSGGRDGPAAASANNDDSISVSSSSGSGPSKTTSNRRSVRAAAQAEPSVVRLLKARARADLMNFKLLQERSKGADRAAAFVSALALITLAWYGQDLIVQLGELTSLPVEEIDWAIYFLIAFQLVSLVMPNGGVE